MKALLAVALTVAVVVVPAGQLKASPVCAPEADACVIVNANTDENLRDGMLTLREAIYVSSGALAVDDLTDAEAAQVHVATPEGLEGVVDVNFDPAVFCEGCATQKVMLLPPGLGGSDSLPPGLGGSDDYSGALKMALPPGLGGSDRLPPGLGGSDDTMTGRALRLGMGVVDGAEVPAPVILDGSALPADFVGLWSAGAVWLRGVHLQNMAGHALELEASGAGTTLVGSNGDGVNDDAEAVTFEGNGADVVVVGF